VDVVVLKGRGVCVWRGEEEKRDRQAGREEEEEEEEEAVVCRGGHTDRDRDRETERG